MSVKSMFLDYLDPFFPPECTACGRVEQHAFCGICRSALIEGSFMQLEGFGTVYSAWEYGGPIKQAVQRMKYGPKVEVAWSLARVVPSIVEKMGEYDAIVPIPLTAKRLLLRGFNPSLEIARHMTGRLETNILYRKKGSQPQVGLTGERRRKNVQDTFFIRNPMKIEGKRVLIVDDVLTTGATLQTAGWKLREAGARHVDGFVLARSVSDASMHPA